MAAKNWPWPMNQPGQPYPAEILRAQHHSATSGGNGVSTVGALKVSAQAAPDGTIRVAPGGADVVSTYAGQDGQSYNVVSFTPQTIEIPPTGSSSGGRHDLIVLRVCDPQFDDHPEAQRNESGEITAKEAAKYDFWWIEVVQGRSADIVLPYPHVKLAHIRRPANTTIVANEHIVGLRRLTNPKNRLHMRANQLKHADTEHVYSGSTVWPEQATHYMEFPEWATVVYVSATWGTIRSHERYGDAGNPAHGQVQVRFTHPDGSTLDTQASLWNFSGDQDAERISVVLGDNRNIPKKFRGESIRVEMLGTKRGGPNVYMDGASSWVLQVYFEQGAI